MEDRIVLLESKVARLTERVTSLEQRLALVERRAATDVPSAMGRPAVESPDLPSVVDFPKGGIQQLLALAGRTLVVLGGAYLLRALTESNVLTASAGVGLGILYGAPWLLLASRAAGRGAELDAFVHALTAALIGYPLVWEATLRFGVVSSAQGAALLGVLTASALALAWARGLKGLAWVVMLGTAISAVGLAIGTGDWTAYTVLAIGLGIATLWLGYTRDWTILRWPAAAIANTMLLILTGRAVATGEVNQTLIVQLLMLAGYLGSFAVRTLLIGRRVIPFEVVQSIGVLVIAYGGAIVLIRSTGSNVVVGVASLALATAGYLVAFAFVDRRRHVRNFFFYAVLAQLFAVVGIALSVGGATGSVVYAFAAFLSAALARRTGRLVLLLQAAVYAIAATLASGLAAHAVLAMLIPPTIEWGANPVSQIVALAAIGFVTFVRIRHPVEAWGIFESMLHVVVIAVLTCTVTGTVIALSIAVLPGGEHMAGSFLATVRTVVFVTATLLLAIAARLAGGREAAWLVYPMLLLTGAKVVLVDFPQGRPQTLFAALAFYGIGLILAPRLLRRVPAQQSTGVTTSTCESPEHSSADVMVTAGSRRM
jgi:hypothetical protein